MHAHFSVALTLALPYRLPLRDPTRHPAYSSHPHPEICNDEQRAQAIHCLAVRHRLSYVTAIQILIFTTKRRYNYMFILRFNLFLNY